ncbi:MAG TPA: nickel transporter permease [bacterium]|nr:nickel transporter permease [bacterium]
MSSTPISIPRSGTRSPAGVRSSAQVVWAAFRRNPLTLVGLVIVAGFVVTAAAAPILAIQNPLAQDLAHRLDPPSIAHPFGLDSLGRDVFSRVLYGARISVVSGISVVSAALAFGVAAGTAAGWRGGWWDEVLMRVTDMFLAFPSLVLAMAISAILTPSLTNALIAITIVSWTSYARLARAQTLALRHRDYIEAARAQGAQDPRIVLRHLIPNAVAPLFVQATLEIGGVILTSAGLAFIGFGAQPPTPEWGIMVSEGRSFLMDQWWVATFPAVAILLLVLGFNLLGDGIRDVLDPRLRKTG